MDGLPKAKLAKRFTVVDGVIVPAGTKPAKKPSASPAAGAGAPAGAAAAGAGGAPREYIKSELSVDERVARCLSVGQECIQPDELAKLLAFKDHPVAYDGFEPSGRVHIAQGILKAINVNKLTSCGVVFKFWVADWFAMLNNKMGGDLKKIRVVGEYMIEVWRAAGMDMRNVEFLWASEEINARSDEYWMRVMDICTKFKLPRMKRCGTIMGRGEEDDLSTAQILYPAMQAADIFFLKADICQLGMDQRKVNMLAREYCDLARPKIRFKPIILSHPMLMGLKAGQEKMSKSDPASAIFMEDTAAEVKTKITKAHCAPGEVDNNPVLNWVRHVVFGKLTEFFVDRPESDGGPITYGSADEVDADFAAGTLHPKPLKAALIRELNAMLEPVRKHFASGKPAQLLKRVKAFRTTR